MIRKVACYLVIGQDYWKYSTIVRMTKGTPRLNAGEIAVRVNLGLDSTLFNRVIPTVDAEVTAPQILEPSIEIEDAPEQAEVADESA